MKRKMFMSIVMSIVLALGVLGQAVAAKVITPSPYEPAPVSGLTAQLPGVKGGVPYMCNYSSPDRANFTITCAQDINYSPNGFYAIGRRSVDLNVFEVDKYVLSELLLDIDELALDYKDYLRELDELLKYLNRTTLTWDELNNYCKERNSIGFHAQYIRMKWEFLEDDIKYINKDINFLVAP